MLVHVKHEFIQGRGRSFRRGICIGERFVDEGAELVRALGEEVCYELDDAVRAVDVAGDLDFFVEGDFGLRGADLEDGGFYALDGVRLELIGWWELGF